MFGRSTQRGSALLVGPLVAAVVVGSLTVASLAAPAAVADQAPSGASVPTGLSPVVQRNASTNVTADALPTTQIDGVAWTQVVSGNTVYVGGSFANARPAGATPGTNQTARGNLLAYDITTGVLNTTFAPSLNAQVKALALSPDGTRLYVGGSFTTANGVARNHLAAYNTSTGALISSWNAGANATVNAIVATGSAVYVGGAFSAGNGKARSRLAAFDPSTGTLLGWAPTADADVQALVMTPDKSRIIAGGSFANVNGSPAYGLASVDAGNGTLYPFAANQTVRDAGTDASILSLSTDGTSVFSTAYVYGNTGNFEGVMSADPYSGNINWLADCHGDTYGTYPTSDTVYVVSHMHFCSNVGAFPETNPRTFYRTTAFTKQATGMLPHNGEGGTGYGDFYGQPSPSMINWYPSLAIGSVTGQNQAAWTVSGNAKYVVEGGEFPSVNNTAQQGLVRFAVPSVAPDKQGPQVSAADFTTTVQARSSTSARVSWQTNWDRDDQNLTYTVTRDGSTVDTETASSQYWNRPTIGFIDTGLSPGTRYTYRVSAADADGNVAYGNSYSVTTPTSQAAPPDGPYVRGVLADGASHYWRLDQAAGAATDYDYAGFDDLTLSGVAAGAGGAVGDGDTASKFDGNSSFAAGSTPVQGPDTFTESAWFATSSTSGGKLVGFGNSTGSSSSSYDRHVYLDPAGHLNFGVYNNNSYVITSPRAYNDGAFHQVTASLSAAGMKLYVDGRLVGTNSGTTIGQPYRGYWHVGGDSTWSGSKFFTGVIDDVAIYPTALTAAQVARQFSDSGRGGTAPSDSYGAAVFADTPDLYYRMDDRSGTTATDSSGTATTGTYAGGVTLGVASPVTGPSGTAAAFNGTDATVYSRASYANPTVYSEELWFRTTTTSGGKLIGFGSSQTGNSGSYDRHVYMLPSGQLVFGTYTGALNLATSDKSYNDGAWHHVAATQGPDGMTLYVDGASVASNPQTQAQAYTGYWRIGGDNLNGWTSGGYFQGSIDEAAVYSSELTPDQVRRHFQAGLAPANVAPTASFTATPSGASVAFDASASRDTDGSVAGYAWDFGDASTGTGVAPSHVYAASGTYQVTLTVTDDKGATNKITRAVSVTVPPANKAPTAAFTAAPTGLSVAFDGRGSSDPENGPLSYAWDFGDNSTSAAAAPAHTYATGGTYRVGLTVTDNGGLTDTVTKSVTVTAPTSDLADDAFTRSAATGWGSADNGGAYTLSGSAASFAVSGGAGSMTLDKAGANLGAYLGAVAARDVNTVVDTSVQSPATGGGTNLMLVARHNDKTDYRLKELLKPGGVVHLAVSKLVNGTETTIREINVAGLAYQPGDVLRVRFVVTGSDTATLAGSVWKAGTAEPAAQLTVTDSTAALQTAGSVAILSQLSSSSTTTPVVATFDNLVVTPS